MSCAKVVGMGRLVCGRLVLCAVLLDSTFAATGPILGGVMTDNLGGRR